MKLKLKTYQKLIIITIVVTIAFVGFYLRSINIKPEVKNTQNPVITPPKLTSDQTSTQRVFFDWQNKTYQGPSTGSLLSIKSSFITEALILDMSKKFGFNNSNEIDTKRKDSYLWVTGQKSLSATIPKGPLTYQNLDLKPASVFKTKNDALAETIKVINTIIDTEKIKLIPQDDIELLKYNPETTFLEPATEGEAQFASLFLYQSINGIAYLPPTPNNSVIRITINSIGQIRSLEVIAGISEVDLQPSQKLNDFETIRKTAELNAKRLTINNNIEEDTDILAVPTLHIRVTNIDLVYTAAFTDSVVQPVYRISGIFTDDALKGRPVSYIIQAL